VDVIAARARPARAHDHAQRGDFVFGLDDRERRLAVLVHAVFPHVADERFGQRRGRGDRIPRDDRDAGEQASHRRGRVALDQNLAARLVQACDAIRIALLQVLGSESLPRLERAHVERHRFRLLAELFRERLLHLAELDREQAQSTPS
jgi:hypothetical protein